MALMPHWRDRKLTLRCCETKPMSAFYILCLARQIVNPNIFGITKDHFYKFCSLIIRGFFFGGHLLTLPRELNLLISTSSSPKQQFYYEENNSNNSPTDCNTASR